MARKKNEPDVTPVEPKRPIQFKYLPIDLLVPNTWNINVQDELTFARLQDEIAEVGMIDPVEVVPTLEGLFVIIGGEHRWRAAKNLNHEEVPCVILTDEKWADGDLQKFVSVRMNVIHGKVDADKFVILYNEMANKYGADSLQRLLGYTDSRGFQKMLGWVKKGLKQSLPKEMAGEIEEATKEATSIADVSRIVQELFQKYGDTLASSFMVFTYGKQAHIYVKMSAKMRRSMDRVMEFCRTTGQDINQVMAPAVDECVRKATVELEKARAETKEAPPVVAADTPEW